VVSADRLPAGDSTLPGLTVPGPSPVPHQPIRIRHHRISRGTPPVWPVPAVLSGPVCRWA